MQTITEQLTYARENRGYTQKQLAEKLGYSEDFIVKLELGELDPPVSVLTKITGTLNWSLKIGDVSI